MLDFVQSTIEMISINLADEDAQDTAYEKAVGGKRSVLQKDNIHEEPDRVEIDK